LSRLLPFVILVGGGLVVWWLWKFMKQRSSAQKLTASEMVAKYGPAPWGIPRPDGTTTGPLHNYEGTGVFDVVEQFGASHPQPVPNQPPPEVQAPTINWFGGTWGG
jgi:hypothetical protein